MATEDSIWFYFTQIPNSDDARCNKCGEVIKRPKTRPTTQLTRHLKKHSELDDAHTKAKRRKEDEAKKKVDNQMRLDWKSCCLENIGKVVVFKCEFGLIQF